MVRCFSHSSFAIRFTYANETIQNQLFETSEERPGEDIFTNLLSGYSDSKKIDAVLNSNRIYSYYNEFLTLLADVILNQDSSNIKSLQKYNVTKVRTIFNNY
jgi:hypothetical protein